MIRPLTHFFLLPACIFIFFLTFWAYLPGDGFWVKDNGHKFLLLSQAEQTGQLSSLLPWSGKALDPEGTFFPIQEPFARQTAEGFQSQYPLFFILLWLLPLQLFGMKGLTLVACLSGFVLCLGLDILSKPFQPPFLIRLCIYIGTPLLFYSFVYWEHIPAITCFWIGTLCLLPQIPKKITWIGIPMIACSLLLREEMLLALPPLFLASPYLFENRTRFFWITLPACLLAGVIYSMLAPGSDPLVHFTGNMSMEGSLAQYARNRLHVFHQLFIASHPDVYWNKVGWILLSLSLVGIWRHSLRIPAILLYGFLITGYIFMFLTYPNTDDFLLRGNGLLFTFPILFWILIPTPAATHEPQSLIKGLRLFLGSFLLLIWLTCPLVTAYGIHWSARILLGAIPPCLFLIILQHPPSWQKHQHYGLCVFLFLSITLQGLSLLMLQEKKNQNHALLQTLQHLPKTPVVTDLPYLAEDLATLSVQRPFFLTLSESSLQTLLERMKEHRVHQFLWITNIKQELEAIPASFFYQRRFTYEWKLVNINMNSEEEENKSE